jgi:hypothetical protein
LMNVPKHLMSQLSQGIPLIIWFSSRVKSNLSVNRIIVVKYFFVFSFSSELVCCYQVQMLKPEAIAADFQMFRFSFPVNFYLFVIEFVWCFFLAGQEKRVQLN